jgi:acetyltransferase-like isoleucine patch superfamily enzyme
LSPRVALAGFVTVEEMCILGINATVIDNINIVSKTQIGGGSVVIKNIEQSGLYVGNPIRFIR